MSTNIFSVLNTAKVALLAQQLAIEVTGHNIANVETEGYSRQEVGFEANSPRRIGSAVLGTGVKVSGVERFHDFFLFRQIISEGDPTGNFRVRKDVFDQLEILFNESSGRSLNDALGRFFGSLQDLSTNPSGLPERAAVLEEAENVVAVFKQMGDELLRIQASINSSISNEVDEINKLTAEIATLNKGIFANEPGNLSANDLRDSRDSAVRQLSEKIDITLLDESDGQISITLGDGTPLVLKGTTFDLSVSANGDNRSYNDVLISDGASGTKNVTSLIDGGELKGYLDMRDTVVESLRDQMDRLAAGFVQEVNRVHQAGFGLKGTNGVNFFTPLTVGVTVNTANTGSASVSIVNASPTTVPVDQFEIEFTDSSTFTLNNLTTGFASGTFSFTSGSVFNLQDGFAVTITGTPATGDRFIFSVSEGASINMSVSSEVLEDKLKIAAGKNSSQDGSNALDLADLQDSLLFDSVTLQSGSGSFTFNEFYNAIVSSVGIQSFSAASGVNQQEAILLQLVSRRESNAGVSIDEEMINMIKFQQAFNAAARLIVTVQEMLDVLQERI